MSDLSTRVLNELEKVPIFDLHTHLSPPAMEALNLWGPDELVTYHYLVAEVMRFAPITPEEFWAMSKQEQADLIWQKVFVENTPISEAAIGVCTVFSALGIDPCAKDLREARAAFAGVTGEAYLDRVLKMSNVASITMTNDPFLPTEDQFWRSGAPLDPRFLSVLRLDPILNTFEASVPKLQNDGFRVEADFSGDTIGEIRRFLDEWIARMKPVYLAVSLPPTFDYPEHSSRGRILHEAILPTCRDHRLSFAMMIGVKKRVNPRLVDAGDSLGHANIDVVERLCRDWPDNKFLVTMLSRENQHELVVAARKFANLMPFGCWWFMNNPSIIGEITRERIEMLGTSFIPQHSDARVLDQLIYKWKHSRRIIAEALTDSYEALERASRRVDDAEIARDAHKLLAGNARSWLGLD